MSKPKVTRISPPEQASKTVPLADLSITWMPPCVFGGEREVIISGRDVARLLGEVGRPDRENAENHRRDLDLYVHGMSELLFALAQYDSSQSEVDWNAICWTLHRHAKQLRQMVANNSGDFVLKNPHRDDRRHGRGGPGMSAEAIRFRAAWRPRCWRWGRRSTARTSARSGPRSGCWSWPTWPSSSGAG